jgi:predicted porin
LAVLAAASGAAMAQSSVTLFGIVDATYAVGRGSMSNKTRLTNSGLNSSRLGFRGTEDLGGGMAASFWLEAGLGNDDGQGGNTNSNNQASGTGDAVAGRQGLTFNRRSTVSLSGGFGEVRLGRDYTPQFWNLTVFDPFGTNGVGTSQTLNGVSTTVTDPMDPKKPIKFGFGPAGFSTGVRASNSIGYFLPGNLGGFYGQVQYYLGENSSSDKDANQTSIKKDGSGAGVRFGFANGPINIALAASKTKYTSFVDLEKLIVKGNVQALNVGGEYDLGVAKLMAQYNEDKLSTTEGSIKGKGWLLGTTIPVGAGEIRAAYSVYKLPNFDEFEMQTNKFALGYTHNLSKRTAVYTTYARLKNKGFSDQALNSAQTGLGKTSSGFDLGIRHSF